MPKASTITKSLLTLKMLERAQTNQATASEKWREIRLGRGTNCGGFRTYPAPEAEKPATRQTRRAWSGKYDDLTKPTTTD
jgi:hypothetical protein